MLLKSEDDHFTAGNVVEFLTHIFIFVQSSEFHQGKTYIFQDSSKGLRSQKFLIDFKNKISKILLKWRKSTARFVKKFQHFLLQQ